MIEHTHTELRRVLRLFMEHNGPRAALDVLVGVFRDNAARHEYRGDMIAAKVSLAQSELTRRLANELPMK